MALAARETLPESVIGLHVGRDGDGLYQGDDDEGYGRERFGREIGPYIDQFHWEAKTEVFERLDWQRALTVDVLGAVARVQQPISRDEARRLGDALGYTWTADEVESIARNGDWLIYGKSLPLIFWEGPEYGIQWNSQEKAYAARVALAAGASGTMVGVPKLLEVDE